jgi:hypothetical protein
LPDASVDGAAVVPGAEALADVWLAGRCSLEAQAASMQRATSVNDKTSERIGSLVRNVFPFKMMKDRDALNAQARQVLCASA